MKTALTILFALVASCRAADVVLGRMSDISWSGSGADKVAVWSTGNWWDGLGLSSLWSVTNGTGTNITADVGSYAGWTIGNPTWTTLAGKSALLLDGNGDAGKFGDIYDLGTNGIAYGAWVWFSNTNGTCGVIGKPYYGFANGRYALYRDGSRLWSVIQGQTSAYSNLTCVANVPTGVWINVAHVISRPGWTAIYTNGSLCAFGGWPDNGAALDVARMMTFGTYDDNSTLWMSGAVRDYWVRVGNNLTNTPAAVWQATRAEYGY